MSLTKMRVLSYKPIDYGTQLPVNDYFDDDYGAGLTVAILMKLMRNKGLAASELATILTDYPAELNVINDGIKLVNIIRSEHKSGMVKAGTGLISKFIDSL